MGLCLYNNSGLGFVQFVHSHTARAYRIAKIALIVQYQFSSVDRVSCHNTFGIGFRIVNRGKGNSIRTIQLCEETGFVISELLIGEFTDITYAGFGKTGPDKSEFVVNS